MAILNYDQIIASTKQLVPLAKTAARTTVATAWFSVFDLAGNPGAGTLAGSNTANGVVPTDATAGFPVINGSTNNWYLSTVDFGNSVACRMAIYDMLFKAGAYAFNANTTLATQPSYASRVVGGDYKGTQIWIEAVTAFTGNLSVAVTYTNQDGTTARTTGTVATGVAPTVGRMIQLPLQAGDSGVQKIESVIATVATVGTFNVLVLEPLWTGRVKIANDGDVHGPDKTGLPRLFGDSAIGFAISADSTSTGVPELQIEVANG